MSDPLGGWKLTAVIEIEPGIVEIGHHDEEGNWYAVVTIDTDNYDQPEAAVPIARAIIVALAVLAATKGPVEVHGGDAPAAAQAARDAERLAWLHSQAACDVDGYEWGIFRVKWEQGRASEVWQTASDFRDLDAALAATKESR